MRIHRVKLENFRGVREVEVEFPTDGVTIIEGDNEIGKTSISEAVDLVLSERDDSNKRQVRAVRPVGRDVGAEVEIEMSTGPYRFKLRKRWHRQKETVLEVYEPKKLQLTGREAHDKVREILEETLDAALWEALHLRQGTELHQAEFAGGSLGRALDISAGSGTVVDDTDDLWDRITAERDRYWTSTGHPRVERVNSEAGVKEAQASVDELEAVLRSLEDNADEVARLVSEAGVLAERMAAQEEVEAGLAERTEKIREYRNAVTMLSGKYATASAQRESAASASEKRASLIERAENAALQVRDLERQVSEAAPVRQQADAAVAEAKGSVHSAKERAHKAEIEQRQANADRDFRRQEIELAQLTERHGRIVEALAQRSAATAVLEGGHVDATLLGKIEEAHVDLTVAEAAIATGATSITAEALADVDILIDAEPFSMGAGEQRELVVTGSAEVVVPGEIRIAIKAGDEAQTLSERAAEAREALEALCQEGRVADLAEAREAAGARSEAERVLTDTSKSISQDLRDLTADGIAVMVDKLKTRVAVYESERRSDSQPPADLDAAERLASDAEKGLAEARQELDRFEGDLARASGVLQEVDLGDAGLSARLEQARQVEIDEQSALEAARQALGDADLADQLGTAESALAESEAALDDANAKLEAEDPTSAEELLSNARAVKGRLGDEIHANEGTVRDLRTTLAVKGEEGTANKLDAAKSALVRLAAAHEQLERRAAAAKLLYDTFANRRSEAHHRYVAPFRESIERLGRLVFGPTLEIELDDDLRVARRTLNGVILEFDDLSTGAKEQLGMISRLACAAIVATDGGAPVIFDDALGWSDPRRLDRMGAVISSAGRSCQIIVLTCTPGRYASVGNAKVVQLPG